MILRKGMTNQDFENLIAIRTPCPEPNCLWGWHFHHFVEDFYFCYCGWKIAGEFFIPEIYEGEDWDEETQKFIQTDDDIITDE